MVIRYPTGLYDLTAAPNVTYVVSNSAPPRANLQFPKLAPGVQGRAAPPPPAPPVARAAAGQLAYSTSRTHRSAAATGTAWRTGDVLEFSADAGPALAPLLAEDLQQGRHDAYAPDLAALGLTAADQAALDRAALSAQRTLTERLNAAKRLYADLQRATALNQQLLNEAARTAASLTRMRALADDPTLAAIAAKLQVRTAALQVERAALIGRANAAAAAAATAADDLRSLEAVTR